MTILNVFFKDTDAIMNNERWLISKCKFPNSPSLQSTFYHFFRLPSDMDLHEHLGAKRMTPYRFIVRKPKVIEKFSQYNTKTSNVEVRKVSYKKCCLKHCC